MNYKRIRRIRELREDNDFTQAQIAALLNCSQVSYSNYEAGRRDIPIDSLVRLAEFYNVSVDYLLGLSNVRERYE